MSQLTSQNLERFIGTFKPLNQIPEKYHAQLAPHLRLFTVTPGGKFIRNTRQSNTSHFLLQGRVEIRESFDNRYPVTHKDQQLIPLEEQVSHKGTIKALTSCMVMAVENDIIDQYLLWNSSYNVCHLDDGELAISDDDMIDDSYQEDWENVFFQSPLATNLSNMAIHQLMSQLHDVPVKANQTIIKARSNGDYFYMIKKGFAEVHTDQHGPFKGEVFQLTAGNYFGDEALVASTTRNATIIMSTDGLLGRLNIDEFNHIIKSQLIPPFEVSRHRENKKTRILDVRFAAEYKKKHQIGSTNIPISHLRKQLTQMDNSYTYILSPANDKRSELATYLMRQAGFNAYLLSPENTSTAG